MQLRLLSGPRTDLLQPAPDRREDLLRLHLAGDIILGYGRGIIRVLRLRARIFGAGNSVGFIERRAGCG